MRVRGVYLFGCMLLHAPCSVTGSVLCRWLLHAAASPVARHQAPFLVLYSPVEGALWVWFRIRRMGMHGCVLLAEPRAARSIAQSLAVMHSWRRLMCDGACP